MALKRLFSNAIRPSPDIPAVAQMAAITASHDVTPANRLPPLLYRHIAKHISALRNSRSQIGNTAVPNPFLYHRGAKRGESQITGKLTYHWIEPKISVRRQKLLLQRYSAEDLPPSPANPLNGRPVKWIDGTIVNWEGKVRVKSKKQGPYAGRKIMFKGHLDERARPQKMADRQERMDGMEKRIAEWRKNKAEEKVRSRPSLPF
ncbi:uncharacterized protein L203_103198 [Cryptococcus depauperatus CBS 7841]|uniref:Large ribosomal subunit protein mL59 domain-containing protein n=1 Tax=Cryptococcus depauperatus CBS 7841 TaxID=1295531 RepID=A0A1E3IPF3_9TREE|nr:hypothetical protein L203_01525 [Cryptococcus depauperatus CBS 7841]